MHRQAQWQVAGYLDPSVVLPTRSHCSLLQSVSWLLKRHVIQAVWFGYSHIVQVLPSLLFIHLYRIFLPSTDDIQTSHKNSSSHSGGWQWLLWLHFTFSMTCPSSPIPLCRVSVRKWNLPPQLGNPLSGWCVTWSGLGNFSTYPLFVLWLRLERGTDLKWRIVFVLKGRAQA